MASAAINMGGEPQQTGGTVDSGDNLTVDTSDGGLFSNGIDFDMEPSTDELDTGGDDSELADEPPHDNSSVKQQQQSKPQTKQPDQDQSLDGEDGQAADDGDGNGDDLDFLFDLDEGAPQSKQQQQQQSKQQTQAPPPTPRQQTQQTQPVQTVHTQPQTIEDLLAMPIDKLGVFQFDRPTAAYNREEWTRALVEYNKTKSPEALAALEEHDARIHANRTISDPLIQRYIADLAYHVAQSVLSKSPVSKAAGQYQERSAQAEALQAFRTQYSDFDTVMKTPVRVRQGGKVVTIPMGKAVTLMMPELDKMEVRDENGAVDHRATLTGRLRQRYLVAKRELTRTKTGVAAGAAAQAKREATKATGASVDARRMAAGKGASDPRDITDVIEAQMSRRSGNLLG